MGAMFGIRFRASALAMETTKRFGDDRLEIVSPARPPFRTSPKWKLTVGNNTPSANPLSPLVLYYQFSRLDFMARETASSDLILHDNRTAQTHHLQNTNLSTIRYL